MITISMSYNRDTKGSAELPLKVEIRTCNFRAMLAMWSGAYAISPSPLRASKRQRRILFDADSLRGT